MSDPYVRPAGDPVTDIDGVPVAVGVDYDTVTIHSGPWVSGGGIRLDAKQAEEFMANFVSACWQAGRQQERMSAEAERPAEGERNA